MHKGGYTTCVDQVAERLRQGMLEGRWRNTLPGRKQLAAQLDTSEWTIEEAMRQLARDGWLVSQGAGRRRLIILPSGASGRRVLRVGVLPFEAADRHAYYLLQLQHHLNKAGHQVTIPSRTLTELGMDAKRVARVVAASDADVWVLRGASREVLTWFTHQQRPFLAYAGHYPPDVPIASVAAGLVAPTVTAIRRLIELGHRRIVLLTRGTAKPPFFLQELESHGIPTGPYNLPDCGVDAKTFHRSLTALFSATPPTALIIDTLKTCIAAQLHLSRMGILAPRDVSIVCVDSFAERELWTPPLSRIRWDQDAIVKRITRWVNAVASGKGDKRRVHIPAEFVEGGTIGPVPGG